MDMRAPATDPLRVGYGERLAVLVIDVTRGGVEERWSPDSHTRPILGPISQILAAARRKGVPVFYTRGGLVSLTARAAPVTPTERGSWVWKTPMHDDRGTTLEEVLETMEIPPEIAPLPDETVITKYKPSGFFESPLDIFLTFHRIDAVIVCGSATNSGVLYTVNDAFSLNYRVIVPRECVASRTPEFHDVSLQMMSRTAADVVPVSEVLAHLDRMEPQGPAYPAHALLAPRTTSGSDARMGFGDRLAVVVVDMHQLQIDPKSRVSYEAARHAVDQTARLLEMARAKNLPIFYTTGGLANLTSRYSGVTATERGSYLFKTPLTDDYGESPEEVEAGMSMAAPLAPRAGETVVKKYKSSGFFGSPLKSFLTLHRVDTVIVCGISTHSGVLFTVNDASSHNYRVIVPRECCAGRDERLHELSLEVMDQRRADVMGIDELLADLQRLPAQEPVA